MRSGKLGSCPKRGEKLCILVYAGEMDVFGCVPEPQCSDDDRKALRPDQYWPCTNVSGQCVILLLHLRTSKNKLPGISNSLGVLPLCLPIFRLCHILFAQGDSFYPNCQYSSRLQLRTAKFFTHNLKNGESIMKKLLLLAIVLMMVVAVFADVTIGTGQELLVWPISNINDYVRSVSLFTAAEINAAGTITDLMWNCVYTSPTSFPIKINLKHTTATTLVQDYWDLHLYGSTPVFEATLAVDTPGWFNFDITDFAYNGTDNLLVITQSGPATFDYSGQPIMWWNTPTDPTMFIAARADYLPPPLVPQNR